MHASPLLGLVRAPWDHRGIRGVLYRRGRLLLMQHNSIGLRVFKRKKKHGRINGGIIEDLELPMEQAMA